MKKIVYLRGEKLAGYCVFAYDKDPALHYPYVDCICCVDTDILPRGTIKRLKSGEVIKAELHFSAWKCDIVN